MRSLPLSAPLDHLSGSLLVVAPHPDDESLGCGGLIAAATAAGVDVHIAFLTNGEQSHRGSVQFPPARLAARRMGEAIRAAGCLGITQSDHRLHFLSLPDSRASDSGRALVMRAQRRLERLLHDADIRLMLTTARTDPHCDHRFAFELAKRAAIRCGRRCLSYPVWTWQLDEECVVARPARAGWRLDVGWQLSKKLAAIRAHASQHGLVVKDEQGFCLPDEVMAQAQVPYEVILDEI